MIELIFTTLICLINVIVVYLKTNSIDTETSTGKILKFGYSFFDTLIVGLALLSIVSFGFRFAKFGAVFVNAVLTVWAITNYYKLTLRHEILLPEDLRLSLSGAKSLLGMISPTIIFLSVLTITSEVLIQAIFFELKPIVNYYANLLVVLFAVVWWWSELTINSGGTLARLNRAVFGNSVYIDMEYEARKFGPLKEFLNLLNIIYFDREDNHSPIALENDRFLESTTNSRNINYIQLLNESYITPSIISNCDEKIMGDDKISDGRMITTEYGGGTANVEFESLTGIPRSIFNKTITVPYQQIVGKFEGLQSTPQEFSNSYFVHSFNSSMYSRPVVLKKLGFNNQIFADDFSFKSKIEKNPYISDRSFFLQLLKITSEIQSEDFFVQGVSMQNHMPYLNYYSQLASLKAHLKKNVIKKMSDLEIEQLDNYLKGIIISTNAFNDFEKKLAHSVNPYVLLIFGDHFPGLFPIQDIEDQPLKYHTTQWNVFGKGLPAQTKMTIESLHGKYLAPSDFYAISRLTRINTKLTDYDKFRIFGLLNIDFAPFVKENDNSILFIGRSDGKEYRESELDQESREYYSELDHRVRLML